MRARQLRANGVPAEPLRRAQPAAVLLQRIGLTLWRSGQAANENAISDDGSGRQDRAVADEGAAADLVAIDANEPSADAGRPRRSGAGVWIERTLRVWEFVLESNSPPSRWFRANAKIFFSRAWRPRHVSRADAPPPEQAQARDLGRPSDGRGRPTSWGAST